MRWNNASKPPLEQRNYSSKRYLNRWDYSYFYAFSFFVYLLDASIQNLIGWQRKHFFGAIVAH